MRVFMLFGSLTCIRAQIFRLPDSDSCEKRVIHENNFGKAFHFSWRAGGANANWDWEGARNYCREFCMDSISITSLEENAWVADIIRKEDIPYIWTGGRKCNFSGCERADLQPAIVNGWYWAPTGKRIPAPRQCGHCSWSATGAVRQAQPDNREQRQGGSDEACIGILNNFYRDGIVWHDIECRHKKPVICQESQELLDFAEGRLGQ